MASVCLLMLGALAALSLQTDCVSVTYYISPNPYKDCYIQGFPFEKCFTLDELANNSAILSNEENVRLFVLENDILRSNITIHNTVHFQILGKADGFEPYIYMSHFTGIFIQANSNVDIANISMHGSMTFQAKSVALTNVTFTNCELNLRGEVIVVSNSMFDNCFPIKFVSSYGPSTHRQLEQETLNERKLVLLNTIIKYSVIQFILLNQRDSYLTDASLNITIKNSFLSMAEDINIPPITLNLMKAMTVFFTLVQTHCIGCINIYTHGDSNSLNLHIEQSKIEEPLIYSAIKLVLKDQSTNNNMHVFIADSIFRVDHGSGLLLKMESTLTNTVKVDISNCTVTGNWKRALDIRIEDSNPFSGEITNTYDRPLLDNKTSICIVIQGSTFKYHQTALFAEISMHLNTLFNLTVINSTFNLNDKVMEVTTKRSQIFTPQHIPTSYSYTFVQLKHNHVENNGYYLEPAIIKVAYINMLIIEDCEIGNNQGTAVRVLFSDVTFSGNTNFFNNSAVQGGALSLQHSHIYLSKSVRISFSNNHVQEVGGAINVKQLDDSMCFYQVPVSWYSDTGWSSLHFTNNSAKFGGDNIYGGSLQRNCKYSFDNTHNMTLINDLFHFKENKSLSSVSSNPKRLCLCDNEGMPQCAKLDHIFVKLLPRYPGEIFTISAVLVGYDFGTVQGNIYAHSYLEKNDNALTSVGFKQRLQEIREHQHCVQLEYSIQSLLTNTSHIIQLNVSQNAKRESKTCIEKEIETYHNRKVITTSLLSQPVLLYVPLEDCPVGFNLSDNICQCHEKLLQNGITSCAIFQHTGRVYRTGTVWLSAVENTTNDFVVHHYCSYDYCSPDNISVDLRFPNSQCAFNRSGILCGGCFGNLSLALGTSQCLSCQNVHASLIIVFVVAGLALVFFIKLLDLTVAKGTINGLILYANIVWAYKSLFLPKILKVHPALKVLYTFLAWLNLDLGIETCFYNGLNAYWKTWLATVCISNLRLGNHRNGHYCFPLFH